jgi:hypothetical protein
MKAFGLKRHQLMALQAMTQRNDHQPTQIKPSCEQALAQSAPAPPRTLG